MQKKKILDEGRYIGNGYYAQHICKECGGKGCCAHFGCMYSPQDFIVLREEKCTHEQRLASLVELVKQGRISIDMVCLKDPSYGPLDPIGKKPDIDRMSDGYGYLFLRARNVNRPVVDFQFFMKTGNHYPCINWNPETGCTLSVDERPAIGRLLNPRLVEDPIGFSYYDCQQNGDVEVIKEWGEHQLLMYDLWWIVRDLKHL